MKEVERIKEWAIQVCFNHGYRGCRWIINVNLGVPSLEMVARPHCDSGTGG